MFNKKIRSTPLTGNYIEDFFSIEGDIFSGDTSFTATLRALLHKRLNGTKLDFLVDCFNATDFSDPAAIYTTYAPVRSDGSFLIIAGLSGLQPSKDRTFDIYDDPIVGFCATYPDYREAKDLRAFVKNRGRLNARFYIRADGKAAYILCEDLELPAYHFLQSLIPRYLPHYFKDIPLDKEEIALLSALTLRTPDEYSRFLSVLASRIDFRSYEIKKIIGDYEKGGRREEIKRTEQQIRDTRQQIAYLSDQYSAQVSRLDSLSITLAGQELALATASDGSELVDYFVCNRNINPVRAEGRTLMFTVKTFLESFDPEQFRAYSRNPASCLYEGYSYSGIFSDFKNRKKMVDAIFSEEPVLKVKICSNYLIDLRGSSSCTRSYNYGDDFVDYVPNPHIHYYACLGNYARYINQALGNGDTIGAIEQCIASAKSLNLAEPHTVRYFLRDVFSSTKNIIRLPDGSDVTLSQAFDYLNNLDVQKEESNV